VPLYRGLLPLQDPLQLIALPLQRHESLTRVLQLTAVPVDVRLREIHQQLDVVLQLWQCGARLLAGRPLLPQRRHLVQRRHLRLRASHVQYDLRPCRRRPRLAPFLLRNQLSCCLVHAPLPLGGVSPPRRLPLLLALTLFLLRCCPPLALLSLPLLFISVHLLEVTETHTHVFGSYFDLDGVSNALLVFAEAALEAHLQQHLQTEALLVLLERCEVLVELGRRRGWLLSRGALICLLPLSLLLLIAELPPLACHHPAMLAPERRTRPLLLLLLLLLRCWRRGSLRRFLLLLPLLLLLLLAGLQHARGNEPHGLPQQAPPARRAPLVALPLVRVLVSENTVDLLLLAHHVSRPLAFEEKLTVLPVTAFIVVVKAVAYHVLFLVGFQVAALLSVPQTRHLERGFLSTGQ